jgi:outer membrane protein TolC
MTAAIALFSVMTGKAQSLPVSLDSCYILARQNYPLIKKQDLIVKSGKYSLENAAKFFLPQLSVNGQASYQSETLSFPEALGNIPGVSLPSISKDQYKIQAELSQQIYDGGYTKNQKALIGANQLIQQQGLEVSLNTLKDRVNQIYFSVLLMTEQLKQNEIRKTDLQGALDKANAVFQNGTGFRSNVDELKAELMNVDMSGIEFRSNRKAYLDMLSLLIGRSLNETTPLLQPEPLSVGTEVNRPELKLYDLQKQTFDIQEKQLKSDYLPRVSAFVQGAYGRPTLNIIENQFGAWWIGGLRLNWSLGSLYSLKNNRNLLHINRQNQDIEKETFLFNTRLSMSQENGEIKKYTDLLEKDDSAIVLRASVTASAKAQLDNGVITVHEYISKLNDENLSRQSRILHHIQWLQAQYQFKTTSGN